jgi:hypothetical protein
LAIGGGVPTEVVLDRLEAVAEALAATPADGAGADLLDPFEVWLCSGDGSGSSHILGSESAYSVRFRGVRS